MQENLVYLLFILGLQLSDELDTADSRRHRSQGSRSGQAHRSPRRQQTGRSHQESGRHPLQRLGLRRIQSACSEAAPW